MKIGINLHKYYAKSLCFCRFDSSIAKTQEIGIRSSACPSMSNNSLVAAYSTIHYNSRPVLRKFPIPGKGWALHSICNCKKENVNSMIRIFTFNSNLRQSLPPISRRNKSSNRKPEQTM